MLKFTLNLSRVGYDWTFYKLKKSALNVYMRLSCTRFNVNFGPHTLNRTTYSVLSGWVGKKSWRKRVPFYPRVAKNFAPKMA